MYSPESIQTLVERIGFYKKVDSSLSFTISEDVVLSTSGRYVNSFHQLAIVENIYSAVPLSNMPDIDFNEYLQEIKTQSVNEVLTLILNRDVSYQLNEDYSNTLIGNPEIFDDAIGYTIAIKVLELFVSTSRKNLAERNAKLAVEKLKVELEGLKNENGKVIVNGIKRERYFAIKQAKAIIFPKKIIVDGTSMW